ncbi:MAG TPA: hypothetical protein VFG91_03285 [Woeseiaceae bacterium]|nr:hypothetical protein [Woeseiaceae bacterium]
MIGGGLRLRAQRKWRHSILELSLEDANREQIASTLNTIANIHLRQNVERQSEEAEQSLKFLNQQLPELQGHKRRRRTCRGRISVQRKGCH